MIECVFTIDYEIYGNGLGSLKELVYEPGHKLKDIFDRAGARMVVFVEVAELEKIELLKTDPMIKEVKDQICELHQQGNEIGLHLHPQWCNARYDKGAWILDYSEYNLCLLAKGRITEILGCGIAYLRDTLGMPDFTPVSFRAGNWLLQPTREVAGRLAQHGIKVDSSVFKGGLQRQQGLDYRRALRNGYYWRFANDVNEEDTQGTVIELPIYSQMVPFWAMATRKRIGIQQKSVASVNSAGAKLFRLMDFLRFKYPLKLDFCRMKIGELTRMVDNLLREDEKSPTDYRPIVAIGHTKDLVDIETVKSFLSYLEGKSIAVSTFENVLDKCRRRLGDR
jgi:hypothetical protein